MIKADCLFCRIAGKTLPARLVDETDHVVAFLDLRPIRPGHLLVVPKRHHAYFDDLPPATASDVMHTAQRLAPLLRTAFGVDRVGLFFTGVDIAHAHAHLVPMVEPTDITSPSYIAERPLTFAAAPVAPADELDAAAGRIRQARGRLRPE